jgi:hypothetical protein
MQMITYKVEFVFRDIDSNLYTNGEGSVVLEVKADDLRTATLIADRVCKVMGADHCVFN